MSSDDDLINKILQLPEQKRADFLEFFGVSAMSKPEMEALEGNLTASFTLKNIRRSAKTH